MNNENLNKISKNRKLYNFSYASIDVMLFFGGLKTFFTELIQLAKSSSGWLKAYKIRVQMKIS